MNRRLFLVLATFSYCVTSCIQNTHIEKYSSGIVKMECEVDDNGNFDGKCVTYFENGKPESIMNYKKNSLDGISKHFHPNGKLSWTGNYLNGQKNGCIDYFDSLEVLYMTGCYKDNKLDGESRTFYSNGNLKGISQYSEGIPIGVHEIFDKKGRRNKLLTFNEKGELVDFVKYDSKGDVFDSFIKMKFYSDKLGDEYLITVKLENSFGNEFGLLIGDISTVKKQLTDTFKVVSSKGKEFIELKYNPSEYKNREFLEGVALDLLLVENQQAVIKRMRRFKFDLLSEEQIYKDVTF